MVASHTKQNPFRGLGCSPKQNLHNARSVVVLTVDIAPKMGGASSRKHPLALQLHDLVNVAALPVLGGLCIAAILGYYDAAKVGNVMQ